MSCCVGSLKLTPERVKSGLEIVMGLIAREGLHVRELVIAREEYDLLRRAVPESLSIDHRLVFTTYYGDVIIKADKYKDTQWKKSE